MYLHCAEQTNPPYFNEKHDLDPTSQSIQIEFLNVNRELMHFQIYLLATAKKAPYNRTPRWLYFRKNITFEM